MFKKNMNKFMQFHTNGKKSSYLFMVNFGPLNGTMALASRVLAEVVW
jgi:hypothetical protein